MATSIIRTVGGVPTGPMELDLVAASPPAENIVVSPGLHRFYNLSGKTRTILGVFASAGVGPVGSDVIADVNKNGVTIFTTQSNRPTVPDGANEGALAIPDVALWPNNEYLTVDVDQVGSSVPGQDLTVQVQWNEPI